MHFAVFNSVISAYIYYLLPPLIPGGREPPPSWGVAWKFRLPPGLSWYLPWLVGAWMPITALPVFFINTSKDWRQRQGAYCRQWYTSWLSNGLLLMPTLHRGGGESPYCAGGASSGSCRRTAEDLTPAPKCRRAVYLQGAKQGEREALHRLAPKFPDGF